MEFDDALCEHMDCPYLFMQPDCSPGHCPIVNANRKSVGAIYMLTGDDKEQFIALLPGMKRH